MEYEYWGSDAFFNSIKEKLLAYKDRLASYCGVRLTENDLCKILEEKGIKVSPKTIERMFNPYDEENHKINLFTLVNVCDILGINVTDVLPAQRLFDEYPKIIWERALANDTVKSLQNRFYEGEYEAYYYSPMDMCENKKSGMSTTMTQKIRHAKLSLTRKQFITEAVLIEECGEPRYDPNLKIEDKTLKGEAKLFIHMNQVHIELMEPNGYRFMNILFPFIGLSGDVLYSQVGALLSVSTDTARFPVLQKIMLTKTELDIDGADGDVVRGVLSMNDNEIIIRKDALQRLSEKNDIVKAFQSTGKAIGTEYFIFREDKLHIWYEEEMERTLGDGNMEYSYFMQALMTLRNSSISAAMYKIKEHDRFNIFSKNLQKGNISSK